MVGAERAHCGRIKDIFFDDSTWSITHLVLSIEPRQFGRKQVLLSPEALQKISPETGMIQLNVGASEVETLPLASSVLTVCKQYASFALASPGARYLKKGVLEADPRLRSARSVTGHQVNAAKHAAGTLVDLIFDDVSWQVRYLAVEQLIDGRKIRFHLLPQSVERFTWSTQRVLLRYLQPVRLESEPGELEIVAAA